ncbi:hypothetical protein [Neorhizobium sp. NCHU2750]|uniref:hypothetical protein n=1 Tax=Neorhizobium sp. NCHU2750 TaxID=1825976 RepID=UPI000E7152F7|nr:NAD synthetase [Neorhizobium sp. NCHU2750]
MWLYENKPFTSDDISDYVGFVYILTDRENQRRYVGKKLFHFTKTLPPLKGSKRKRKKTLESDWLTYCSSSPVIKAIVAEHGIDRFHREIVHLCRSKSEMSYHETRLQFEHDVLLSDEWYNDMIMCRIASKHVRGLQPLLDHA